MTTCPGNGSSFVSLFSGLGCGRNRAAAFDVMKQATLPGINGPGDDDADHVEEEESPERSLRAAGKVDRRSVGFRNEERTECCDRRCEAGDSGRFFLGLPLA